MPSDAASSTRPTYDPGTLEAGWKDEFWIALVGALHLWNEHVPRYSGNGPTLAWAKEMRRRMLRSLGLLADFVERDRVWATVRAFCGDSTLSSRIGGLQMQRLARRHGFEPAQPPAALSRH